VDRGNEKDSDGKDRTENPTAREERQPAVQRPAPESPSPRRTTLGSDDELQQPEQVRDKPASRAGDAGHERRARMSSAPRRPARASATSSVATPIPTAQGSSPAAKPRSIFRATTTPTTTIPTHAHDLDAGRDDDADLGL
jgi:hypothetical protein